MADQLQQWIDKCAIQDLIFRYSDSVNRADWAETAKLYAADAVWESPLFDMHFESGAEFCAHLARSSATLELLIQTPHCPIVTLVTDDTASATTTIHEVVRGTNLEDSAFGPAGGEINFEDYGIYYDEIARLDGEWKFIHRLFVPTYIGQGPVTGDVPIDRSRLLTMA